MKVWELASIVRDDALVQAVAAKSPGWAEWGRVFAKFGALVEKQDRGRLDATLPDDFVLAVLGGTKQRCYRSTDGWLRSWRMANEDTGMSMVEAYKKYGGTVLESVLERGAVRVQN